MIPQSILAAGFTPPDKLKAGKRRRLLIGCDGPADSGKTEFSLSAPGPGMVIVLDRGADPVFDNATPPPTRQNNFAFKVITAPLQYMGTKDQYLEYWKLFASSVYTAANIPECRTIVLDGDSDSWELQRLAEFGKLTQVPAILYTTVNAARRAFYARLWDSGKIIIATNKIKKLYQEKVDASGEPIKTNDGKVVREWDGKTYERVGFDDQEYLWQIQLRNFFDDATGKWGVRLTKCKANKSLEGMELIGDECNFQTLVQAVYPQVPLSEWGYV